MGLEIKSVYSPEFGTYGRVIDGYACEELLQKMKEHTPVPEDVVYVPSDAVLEGIKAVKAVEHNLYGQMPIQAGYCNGHNRKLNAVEYHRDSEINVAVSDLILILGRQQEIGADYTYDTARMEAFLAPAGVMVDIYATTLHYAPCQVNEEGFRCVVILPRGTNMDLEPFEPKNEEDRLLFAKNKWLIGHAEGGLPEGAFLGLKGENLTV